MRAKSRISRIKAVPFLEALPKVAPVGAVEEGKVSCLLPDHSDSRPSCVLSSDGWRCWSCNRGGDIIDFIQEYYGVEFLQALAHAELSLGLQTPENMDPDLYAAKVELKEASREAPDRPTVGGWISALDEIEHSFLAMVRPYLRCRDWLVADLALPKAEYVFSELDLARQRRPQTARGAREKLHQLTRWTVEWALSIEEQIQKLTGKDRYDALSQSSA